MLHETKLITGRIVATAASVNEIGLRRGNITENLVFKTSRQSRSHERTRVVCHMREFRDRPHISRDAEARGFLFSFSSLLAFSFFAETRTAILPCGAIFFSFSNTTFRLRDIDSVT